MSVDQDDNYVVVIYSIETVHHKLNFDSFRSMESNIDQCAKFQVALSFAGEQREYVEEVARCLVAKGIAVFYDLFEAKSLWGNDIIDYLQTVFSDRSDFVVIFVSKEYVDKPWTNHERKATLSQMIQKKSEYVLPVLMDDTWPLPGLPQSTMYLKGSDYSPAQLSESIAEKLGVSRFSSKASDLPPPRETSLIGEVEFDYSNNNGKYVLGTGALEFETKWTKASDTSIHTYNDPPSINGIALAPHCNSISQITKAATLNYSSRSRTLQVGEVLVLRNVNGFYAALQVLNIKDNTRGALHDELKFQYVIQSDRSDNFTGFGGGNWLSNKNQVSIRDKLVHQATNHYRIKQDFDEIDRSDFRKAAYSQIRDYFEISISELDALEHLRGRFTQITATAFSCTIVNRRSSNNTAHITVHGGAEGIGDISYSFTENGRPDTANGCFTVEADEFSLKLKSSMNFLSQQETLTPLGVAEQLWNQFIDQIGVVRE